MATTGRVLLVDDDPAQLKLLRVVLETDGPDEAEALDAIATLIGDCFGEGQ